MGDFYGLSHKLYLILLPTLFSLESSHIALSITSWLGTLVYQHAQEEKEMGLVNIVHCLCHNPLLWSRNIHFAFHPTV